MKAVRFVSLFATAVLAFLAQSASAASYTVPIANFNFTPTNLAVAVGDTVIWTNTTINTHTSTSGDTNTCTKNSLWDSGNILAHKTFTNTFTNLAAGTYPYFCSIHCASANMKGSLTLTNPLVLPTVVITNPVTGKSFAAPANVLLQADANSSDANITSVQFFSGATLLGSATTPPYNFNDTSLAAGNYSFTAVANDSLGLSATSAVVNIFVLTNAVLTSPVMPVSGRFQFTVLGIAGQTYEIDASSNLVNWFPIGTTNAPANSFTFTDSPAAIPIKFYRTRQGF